MTIDVYTEKTIDWHSRLLYHKFQLKSKYIPSVGDFIFDSVEQCHYQVHFRCFYAHKEGVSLYCISADPNEEFIQLAERLERDGGW